jgi:hypothetical protein
MILIIRNSRTKEVRNSEFNFSRLGLVCPGHQ